jgi:hypothetical protein
MMGFFKWKLQRSSYHWFFCECSHHHFLCWTLYCKTVTTLALGSRPKQGVARKPGSQKEGCPRARAKALEGCGPRGGSPGAITYSWESKEVRGSVRDEHSHSQGNSHFGRGSLSGLPKLQSASWRVKSQWIIALLIPLESSWNVDV